MPHGGSRPGAGRPKGSRTRFLAAEGTSTPFGLLLAVMRMPDLPPALRQAAARAAAPYCHARRAPASRPK